MDADFLAWQMKVAGEQGGDRDSRRGFDDDFHSFEDPPHGRENVLFGHGDDAVDELLNDRKGFLAEIGFESVGNGDGGLVFDDVAGFEAPSGVIHAGGLHREDFDGWVDGFGGDQGACE